MKTAMEWFDSDGCYRDMIDQEIGCIDRGRFIDLIEAVQEDARTTIQSAGLTPVQSNAWGCIVDACRTWKGSINVSGKKRRQAIIAADQALRKCAASHSCEKP